MTFTLNIGTDRNGKPSNAFKTEQEVFSWAHNNGLEVVSQRWAQSEPIGDWPAELILVVKLSGMIPLGQVARLCSITDQHAIAVYDHSRLSGRLVWSDNLPEDNERFPFNADYFHEA